MEAEIANELKKAMKGYRRTSSIAEWLENAFFELHSSLYKNRPIFWHIASAQGTKPAAFGALLRYHRFDVEEDRHTREYRAFVHLRDGFQFPTRVISDGTLRVLALLTALYDPRRRGLICFEEPENGVHPARLRALIERLRRLVTDPMDPEPAAEPLTQLIMNSHSPVVLSGLTASRNDAADVGQALFADLVAVADPKTAYIRRKTRIRLVEPIDQGRLSADPSAQTVTQVEVEQYLATANRDA